MLLLSQLQLNLNKWGPVSLIMKRDFKVSLILFRPENDRNLQIRHESMQTIKNIANFHCTCILVSIFSSFLFNQFLFQNTRNRQKLEILHSLFHTELTKCEFKRVHVDQVKKMFYCQNKEISMEQKKLPNMMIFKEIWQTISLELDYYLTWFWKIE